MRIAILAPTAAPAFLPRVGGVVGGAERQLALLGQALGARGHAVDVLVAEGTSTATDTPGGRLWPGYPLGGLPLLKLVHPKSSALRRFLREAGSEVLLQRGASELTGLGAAAAAACGIPFVFMLSSDRDLESGHEIVPHPQDRALFREGLRRADRRVAQTGGQARRLWRQFGLESTVLPSLWDTTALPPVAMGEAVIWGGNLRPVKRPEWLLALARRFPDQAFIAYGGSAAGSEAYADRMARALTAAPNVDWLGRLAPDRLPGVYAQGRALLNTSAAEGFPNTFLEAWAHGLPVLSSVDPDGELAALGLGAGAPTLGGLAQALGELLAEPPAARVARAAAVRGHLVERHGVDRLVERWERLLAGESDPPDAPGRRAGVGRA